MSDKLTPKQRAFLREYLISRNASEAARKAGYSEKTANREGSRLLSNVDIKAAIEKHEKRLQKKFNQTVEEIIDGLAAIAFINPMNFLEQDKNGQWIFKKDIPEEALMGANFTIYPEYQSEKDKKKGIARAKLSLMSGDRKGAYELLGKHLGMWKDGSGPNSGDRKAILSRLSQFMSKRNGTGGGGSST